VANDIGESINAYLLGQSTVTAIVADRGKPDGLPQHIELPAYTYEVISDAPSHHLSGVSGLRQARLQIDCYADTRKRANQLDEAILALLDMQRGTFGGTYCNTIQAEDRVPDRDQPIDGSDKWRYIAMRIYMIWYIP
jgi:hypothetical protein